MTEPKPGSAQLPLAGYKIIALLSGGELFGHEKGNIEAFKALRDAGADVCVGVNLEIQDSQVAKMLNQLNFETFSVPYGCQWSKTFFRQHPTLVFGCLWKVVRSSWALWNAIRRFKPTHVQLGNPLAYSYVAPTLGLVRIPMVYRIGDEPPIDSKPNLLIWKSCMRRANSIVSISEFIQKKIKQCSPSLTSKSRVLYNKAPQLPAGEITAQWSDGIRHVVYLGQISKHKGVSVLVDAAKSIVTKYPDVEFNFLGGSIHSREYEQEMRNLVESWNLSDRIRFHGQVQNPHHYFNQAAIHVAPSIWEEPLGNVVLEAKLASVPSVVFPSGGLPEMISHGTNGFVCRDKTEDALVEGICYYLDNEGRRITSGQEAFKDLNTRFGESRFQDEWTSVYLTLKSTK